MVLDGATRTKFDIYRILIELSKTNPLFCSELEFQFYLAWKIKEIYRDNFEIRIEHPTAQCDGHNRNIDLLLIDRNGGYIPIELKYRTRKLELQQGKYTFRLKNHAAEDVTKYGHLKDVSRIEDYKHTESNFQVGYAITITNQEKAWQRIIDCNKSDYNFSLEDKTRIFRGKKEWSENTSVKTQKSYPPFILENDYSINWFDYCNFDCKNGHFKVLVTEIK